MRINLKSFNGGFISREAEARTDINSYQKSCRKLDNMIPNIVGSVHKRVGTKFIGEIAGTGDNTKTKLITLVVAEVLSYVLEFSHRTLRIRQSNGEYLTVPNSTDIYEVSTPWTSDQLGKLQAAHKVDALFIVHPEVPPQRVFRAGITNWTVTAIPFNFGEGVSQPWSPSQGYPSVAVFYENRFWLAASRQFPQTLWISSTGDYFDMETKDNDDDGFDRVIAGDGLNAITWMAPARDLVVGTIKEEFVISSSGGKALSNTNISIRNQTAYGSKRIKPLVIDKSVLFVDGSGDKIREFNYTFADDSFSAKDLSILSPLDNEYIKDIVFQQDPDRIIWVLTESGKLFGLTFDKGQEVIAWHKHNIGGKIESICVIPGNKSSDILFLNVTRNGKSSIELLRKGKALGRVNDNTFETYYIDSWKSEAYSWLSSSGGIKITGVNRLANQTVTVIRAVSTIYIAVIGNYIVSSEGTITIPDYIHYDLQSVIVGVPYSCKLTTVPLELNNPGNATVGSKIQLISANFKLSRTQKDLSYFVGDTWSRYDFDLGTELHISRWTGDLPLLGSITEDTVISVGSYEPYALGISAISIVFRITESRK
jgi:hypothetical protein